MIIKEFVGLDKNKATRRALNYWYKNVSSILTLKEFLLRCSLKERGNEMIIIYTDYRLKNK